MLESVFGIICSVLAIGFFVLPASSIEEDYWERQSKLLRLRIESGL